MSSDDKISNYQDLKFGMQVLCNGKLGKVIGLEEKGECYNYVMLQVAHSDSDDHKHHAYFTWNSLQNPMEAKSRYTLDPTLTKSEFLQYGLRVECFSHVKLTFVK